jgi:hypothetical protein
MKRSEMIEKMIKVYEVRTVYEPNAANLKPEIVCHHLLEAIEKNGMLPPFDRALPTQNHISWMRAQGYWEDGTPMGQEYIPPKRRWEEETKL